MPSASARTACRKASCSSLKLKPSMGPPAADLSRRGSPCHSLGGAIARVRMQARLPVPGAPAALAGAVAGDQIDAHVLERGERSAKVQRRAAAVDPHARSPAARAAEEQAFDAPAALPARVLI